MNKKILINLWLGFLLLLVATAAKAQPSAYFQAVTNLNPVAYWPLQETAQPPIADVETNLGSLGAVANAYYSSTNVVKGVTGISSGDSDPALSFQNNLAGSFLAVPMTDNRVSLQPGPFSVEAWIFPTNATASTIVAQTGAAGSGDLNGGTNSAGWSLNLGSIPSLNYFAAANTVSFHVYNGVGSSGGAEATFTQDGYAINNWYHIVAVFDGTNAMIYVNGVAGGRSAVPMSGTMARDTWDPLTIGCGRGLNNNRFGGSIDEVAIYTNALTAAQIQNHYNDGTGGSGTYFGAVNGDNPYMWWRMDAPAYTTPPASAYPSALSYGTLAAVNGLYLSGTTPGVAGPAGAGFGSPSYACAFNGIGTDCTNGIPIYTNGVAYTVNTVAETGVIITNLPAALNLTNANLSFMCWFKENPQDNRRGVLVGHSDNGWRTSMDGGGHITANAIGKQLADQSSSPLTYNDDNWHFMVMTYTNSGVHVNTTGWLATNFMYVDGLLVATVQNTNANAIGSFTNISIGVAPDHVFTGRGNTYDNQVFGGSIAHVAFFTNALTGSQVFNLYTNATGGNGTTPPMITAQPPPYPSVRVVNDGTNGSGNNFIFEAVVAVGGTPTLSYQWYYNSISNYAGATALVDNVTHYQFSTTLQVTITNLTAADSGYYFCVVSNNFASTNSAIVAVQVYTNPLITAQSPSGAFSLFPGQQFTLSVTASSGVQPVGYQWLTSGVAVGTGGNGSNYSITAGISPAFSGSTYQCIVTNLFGTSTSALATLTVLPLPSSIANSAYATNLLALSPTIYFPMHETGPAAPGDTETNYGTLGAIENGTYADWNVKNGAPGNVVVYHQFGGALTNDPDGGVLMNFHGATNSYLFVPRNSAATTLTAPFTAECWMWAGTGTFGDLISQDGTTLNVGNANNVWDWRLSFGASGGNNIIQVLVDSGSSFLPSPNLTLSQWHHIVLTCDSQTNWTLYVDGNQSGSSTYRVLNPDAWDPITIGAGLWNAAGVQRICSGVAMDEVAIYTTNLDSSTIATHYNDAINGAAGQYFADVTDLNPILYYRMDSPAYSTPAQSTWPVMTNYGSAAVNGVYRPGLVPGLAPGPRSGTGFPTGRLSGTNSAPMNGVSTFAQVSAPTALDPAKSNTAFTVSMWLRSNPSDSRYESLISEGTGWQINQGANGKLQVFVANVFNGASVVNDGNWHQAVVTFAPLVSPSNPTNLLTLYIDGTLDATSFSVGYTNPAPDLTDPTGIGADTRFIAPNQATGAGRQYSGNICQVAFWNGTALTSDQVANLFNVSGMPPTITAQPVSASVNAKTAFTNRVAAYGGNPLSYQWYRDGQPLPIGGQTNLTFGATNSSLVINPVATSDESANYYVVISNSGGSVTSSVVSLTVFSQPEFTSEPIDVTRTNNILLFTGAAPTFEIATIGAQPVYYQWFTNGMPATTNGTTLTSYTLPPEQLSGGVTNFFCVASNLAGRITNTAISVTVLDAPALPYPQAVLAANPIGYWRLNEPDDQLGDHNPGAIADDYWGANNGIYTNTDLGLPGYTANQVYNSDQAETSAQFGFASFGDGDAYGIGGVDFSSPANTSVGFSVEAWVNGYPQSKDAGIISKGFGNGGEQFDLDTGGTPAGTDIHSFRFLVRDSAGAVHAVNSTVVPSYGNWYHLVGVCDESNGVVTLYINGTVAGTAAISTSAGILTSTRKMIIGSRPSNSTTNVNDYQFVGDIDDVAVYNYALSANQVGTHYTAAGAPPIFIQAPPANVAVDGFGLLTLPVAAVGTPIIVYHWYDVNGGTNLTFGFTNGPLLDATLTVPNVPLTWNGDTLELTVTNVYGPTNIFVTLTVYTNAPQITTDLPPLVTEASGKSYVYSVGVVGPQPYGYQWYNGATPVTGETNSTYSLVAGSPGSTTYHVVITNIFGASTSSISTFTSVAPPSGYSYATSVLGLTPVGYWPLQETNPPAAATIETNYGRLGALGTAYYVGTNASSLVSFGQGGALGADSDTSVAFNSYSAPNGQGYMLVPSVSPSLALKPPFTIECWALSLIHISEPT